MKTKWSTRFLGALLACAMLCSLFPAALAGWDNKTVTKGDTFDLRIPCECDNPDTNAWEFECDYGVSHRYNSASGKTATFNAYDSGCSEILFLCDNCYGFGYWDIDVEEPYTPEPTKPLGLYLDCTHETLYVGDTIKINAYWDDPAATTNMVWTSSNSNVLNVSGNKGSATVYCVSEGTANVTVRDTISGESDTCYLLVNAGKVTIKLSQPSSAVYSQDTRANELLCAATATDSSGNYIPSSALNYQWYYGYSTGTCNNPVAGGNSATYRPSTTDIGTTYYACAVDYNVGSTHERAITSPVPITVQGETYTLYVNVDNSRLDYKDRTTVTATVYSTNSYGSPVQEYTQLPITWSIDNDSYASLDYSSSYTSNGKATNVLRYSDAASSTRTVTVTASVRIDGHNYSASKSVTLNKYSKDKDRDGYSVSITSNSNSIKPNEIVTLTAKLYDGSNLITKSDPIVTWSLRNANGNVQLNQNTTYSSRGVSTNTLCNCVYLSSSRTVSVQASITIGNQTYVGYKDITLKASSNTNNNNNNNNNYNNNATSTSTQAITSRGTALCNTNIASAINNSNTGASYVMFTEPATNVGKLLYNYTSVAGNNTKVTSSDRVYLNGGNSMVLSNVYFLPAADCASQVQLAYTVYNSGGSKLSTGTAYFNVSKQSVSANFNDVTAAWCADAIDFMAASGIVNGTGNRQFSPSSTMTRAMLLTILYRAAGSPSIAGIANSFSDVNASDYFYAPVLWAYNNGYASANGYGSFGANDLITREEIMSILWKYSGQPAATGSLNSFNDSYNVSSYAQSALIWAVNKGYIKGNAGQILPQGNATRAEVSVILHRFFTE